MPALLIEGLREIRMHLFTGYCVLFSLWLAVGDNPPTAFGLEDLGTRLAELAEVLGPTGRLSALTFTAVMIGGIVERFVLFGANKLGPRSPKSLWTQLGANCVFDKETARLEKLRNEAEFRMHLQLVLTPTLLIFAAKVSWESKTGLLWFIPVVVAPILLGLDRRLLRKQIPDDLRQLIVFERQIEVRKEDQRLVDQTKTYALEDKQRDKELFSRNKAHAAALERADGEESRERADRDRTRESDDKQWRLDESAQRRTQIDQVERTIKETRHAIDNEWQEERMLAASSSSEALAKIDNKIAELGSTVADGTIKLLKKDRELIISDGDAATDQILKRKRVRDAQLDTERQDSLDQLEREFLEQGRRYDTELSKKRLGEDQRSDSTHAKRLRTINTEFDLQIAADERSFTVTRDKAAGREVEEATKRQNRLRDRLEEIERLNA